jgi:hypothetical protein
MSISVSADENKALTRRLFNRITVRFPMLFLILMSLVSSVGRCELKTIFPYKPILCRW